MAAEGLNYKEVKTDTRNGANLFKHQAHLQGHFSSKKATSHNPSQTVPPAGTLVFKHRLWGPLSFKPSQTVLLTSGPGIGSFQSNCSFSLSKRG